MPPEDLKSLLSGRTTSMKDLTIKVEGIDFKEKAKLSLYSMPDNSLAIKVHPHRAEIQNDFNLKPNEIEKLKVGDLVTGTKTSLNGEKEKYIFQLDKEINEIKSIRVNNINLPKSIMDVELTQKNKSDLLDGKSIILKNKEGDEKAVGIDLVSSKGFSVKDAVLSRAEEVKNKPDLSYIDDLRSKNKLNDKDYNIIKEGVIKELENNGTSKQDKNNEPDIARTVRDVAAVAGIKLERDKEVVKAIENPDRKIEITKVADVAESRKETSSRAAGEAIKEPRFLNYNDKDSALSGKAEIYALLSYKFGRPEDAKLDLKTADSLLTRNKISPLEHEIIKDAHRGELLSKASGKTTDMVYSELINRHGDKDNRISPEAAKTLLSENKISKLEHDIVQSRNNGLLSIPEISHIKTYNIQREEKPAEDRMVGRDTRGKLYEGTNVKGEYSPGEVVKWDYKVSPEVMRRLENDGIVQNTKVEAKNEIKAEPKKSLIKEAKAVLNEGVVAGEKATESKSVKLSENPDIKQVATVDLGFVRGEIKRDYAVIGKDNEGKFHEGIKGADDKVQWKSQMSDTVKDLINKDQIVFKFEPKLETGEKISYGKDLKGNYFHTKNEDAIDVGLKQGWTRLDPKEGKMMETGKMESLKTSFPESKVSTESKLSSEKTNTRSGETTETASRKESTSNGIGAPEEKQEKSFGFKR